MAKSANNGSNKTTVLNSHTEQPTPAPTQHTILSIAEVWVAVSFIVFFMVLFKPLRKALLSLLDNHTAKIKLELTEAQKLKEDANRLLQEVLQRRESAITEAKQIIENAQKEAKHIKEKALADVENLIQIHEKKSLDSLAIAEAKAVAEIKNAILDTAVAASKYVLSKPEHSEQGKKLLDIMISDIPSKVIKH